MTFVIGGFPLLVGPLKRDSTAISVWDRLDVSNILYTIDHNIVNQNLRERIV